MSKIQPDKKVNYKVLVVEDDAPTRIFCKAALSLLADNIYLAENGKTGLQVFEEHLPEIVISDINMPFMNGLQLSAKIREIKPNTKIILTTALDSKEAMLEAINLGIDDFIIKPIRKNTLQQSFQKIIKELKLENDINEKSQFINQLSIAIEQSSSLILVVSHEGKIIFANRKASQFLGTENKSIENTSFVDIFPKSLEIGLVDEKGHFEIGGEWHGEIEIEDEIGLQKWLAASLSPIKSPESEQVSYVMVFEDISSQKSEQVFLRESKSVLESLVDERTRELQETNKKLKEEIEERKKIEKQIILAKEAAEKANKAKSIFLAKVSHELRTPMNGILGFSSILMDTQLNEKQQKFMTMVSHSAKSLLSIINDILDYSKIESGKMMLVESKFKIADVIDDCLALTKPKTDEKNLELDHELDPEIPEYLKGDPDRIKQVIMNLLNNSVKFTEKGKIDLNASLLEKNNDSVELLIEIIDTGIGIDPKDSHKLFKSFSQIDGTFTRKHGGTGLGLTISRELVTLMQGKIDFESSPGEGARFFFTVKLKPQKHRQQKNQEDQVLSKVMQNISLDNKHILIAEDSFVNQELLREVFSQLNCLITIVSDGNQAIEAVEAADFDLILMDVQMQGKDGLEATREIRKLRTGNDISIIGLTAHAGDIHKEECLAAGMDDFLSKPFNWSELFGKINNCIKCDQNNQIASIKRLNDTFVDKAKLRRIIDYFLDTAKNTFENIKSSIDAEDFEKVRQLSHKFKSEVGNFEANSTVLILSKIEQKAKSEDKEKLKNLINSLDKSLNKVYNSIRKEMK